MTVRLMTSMFVDSSVVGPSPPRCPTRAGRPGTRVGLAASCRAEPLPESLLPLPVPGRGLLGPPGRSVACANNKGIQKWNFQFSTLLSSPAPPSPFF